jgi:hypothetical protein
MICQPLIDHRVRIINRSLRFHEAVLNSSVIDLLAFGTEQPSSRRRRLSSSWLFISPS